MADEEGHTRSKKPGIGRRIWKTLVDVRKATGATTQEIQAVDSEVEEEAAAYERRMAATERRAQLLGWAMSAFMLLAAVTTIIVYTWTH